MDKTRKVDSKISMRSAKEASQLELLLRERVKELNCLYNLAQIIEQNGDSLCRILQDTVELLPGSWRYPDVTCARIIFKNQTYQSGNFKATRWKQDAAISLSNQQAGMVEVFYLKKKPNSDEGPFLKEERLLINAVGDRIGKAAERIDVQRQLQVERQALQDANIAIHESLIQSRREKKMIGISIQANFDKIIMPIFYALQVEMDSRQLKYLDLLKNNIESIISPFVERDRDILYRLSPVELLICNMIKHGLSSKEIATMRGISPATVNRHRESIRRKLNLTNRGVNLVSYLNNITDKQEQLKGVKGLNSEGKIWSFHGKQDQS
jgi:DNA-binding CsgD family transcriptional regulator